MALPLSFWGKAQHGDLPLPLTTRSVIINLCHLFSQFDNIQGFPCPLVKQSFRVSYIFFFIPPQEKKQKSKLPLSEFSGFQLGWGGVFFLLFFFKKKKTCKLLDLLCVPVCWGCALSVKGRGAGAFGLLRERS